jgi:hypothetical protein
MKILLAIIITLSSQSVFATKYGCNLQKMPRGKIISSENTHKYVKTFNFETPIQKKQVIKFKNIVLTLYKNKSENIYVSFKNTVKDYQISTEFLSTQDILRINTAGDETFICWSEKASASAKDEFKK